TIRRSPWVKVSHPSFDILLEGGQRLRATNRFFPLKCFSAMRGTPSSHSAINLPPVPNVVFTRQLCGPPSNESTLWRIGWSATILLPLPPIVIILLFLYIYINNKIIKRYII